MESLTVPPEMVREFFEYADVNRDAGLLTDVGSHYLRTVGLPVKFRRLVVTNSSLQYIDALHAILPFIKNSVRSIAFTSLVLEIRHLELLRLFPQTRSVLFLSVFFPAQMEDRMRFENLPELVRVIVDQHSGTAAAFTSKFMQLSAPLACLEFGDPGPLMRHGHLPYVRRCGRIYLREMERDRYLGERHNCWKEGTDRERHLDFSGHGLILASMMTVMTSTYPVDFLHLALLEGHSNRVVGHDGSIAPLCLKNIIPSLAANLDLSGFNSLISLVLDVSENTAQGMIPVRRCLRTVNPAIPLRELCIILDRIHLVHDAVRSVTQETVMRILRPFAPIFRLIMTTTKEAHNVIVHHPIGGSRHAGRKYSGSRRVRLVNATYDYAELHSFVEYIPPFSDT
ncbi:hypothetical protein C8J56DRAFT_1061656 [Mycena floridula]|nr:hypothetical protein C8J56DRAFT_1061656 [Mycena floridula]